MITDPESDTLPPNEAGKGQPSGWLKIGVLAVASAVAGGVATAWWYRKTLERLRETGEAGKNPQFGISADESSDEI
jgi:flagellar basal body-associated protein FliL